MNIRKIHPVISNLFSKISSRIMANDLDSATLHSLNRRVAVLERQISSFQSELDSIKNLLSKQSSTSIDGSKKRKLNDDCFIVDITNQENKGALKTDTNGYVHVYTDGACENNGRKNAKAGLGVWFGHNHPLNISEPVKRRPTNNVGEIEACTRSIQAAHSAGIKKLYINTDSQFVINCMTKWIKGWKRKGWKTASGGPVLNKDELTELDETMKLMDDVKWNHVRGHAGIEGNEAADRLARQGAAQYKSVN